MAALLFAASIVGNFLLYRQAMDSYVELQQLRLDPNDAKQFEKANARLPALRPGQKRIVLFGDSRIAMWQPLPDLPGVQIINRGAGSETTDQLLRRIDRDVIGLHPDAVIIEMGINDLKDIGLFPERGREIVNSCNANTDLMLERLRQANVPTVLLTIFPVGNVPLMRRPIWSDDTLSEVQKVNGRWKQFQLPGVTVVDCDPIFSVGGRMNHAYANSTLHLNDAGYKVLDALVEPIIHRLVFPRQKNDRT